MDGTEPSDDLKKGEASRPPPFLRFIESCNTRTRLLLACLTVWLYFESFFCICAIITPIGVREDLMFTVFVLGNIASGKSTACRYLETSKNGKSIFVSSSKRRKQHQLTILLLIIAAIAVALVIRFVFFK